MTRKQTGFILDSVLLFLVALFIYGWYTRLHKKQDIRPDWNEDLVWPDELHKTTMARIEEYKATYTPVDLGLVPTRIPCDTDGVEATEIESLGDGMFRKGSETWHEGEMGRMGVISVGGGRHVPGPDHTTLPYNRFVVGLDKVRRGYEGEEEDNYYDERE